MQLWHLAIKKKQSLKADIRRDILRDFPSLRYDKVLTSVRYLNKRRAVREVIHRKLIGVFEFHASDDLRQCAAVSLNRGGAPRESHRRQERGYYADHFHHFTEAESNTSLYSISCGSLIAVVSA